MIASRWMPRPTPGATKIPRESGPRCSTSAHMRSSRSTSTGPSRDTFPTIPHIYSTIWPAGGGRQLTPDLEAGGDGRSGERAAREVVRLNQQAVGAGRQSPAAQPPGVAERGRAGGRAPGERAPHVHPAPVMVDRRELLHREPERGGLREHEREADARPAVGHEGRAAAGGAERRRGEVELRQGERDRGGAARWRRGAAGGRGGRRRWRRRRWRREDA